MEKLLDAFIALLAGAQWMVEINKRLKADVGLQRAFGRLATSHRNKKRFAAQQILLHLEVLAHNMLIWARGWLAPRSPKLTRLGLKRWVRDVFRMDGFLIFDQALNLIEVHLNRMDPFARDLSIGLAALFAREHVAICLGEI